MSGLKKYKIINSLITSGSYNNLLDKIKNLIKEKKGSYVCFANVHMLIESYDSSSFNSVLNNATIAGADGNPLNVFLQKNYNLINQERFPGMDVFPDLIKYAEENGLRAGFIGGAPKEIELLKEKLNRLHPQLINPIFYSPPFKKSFTNEDYESHLQEFDYQSIDIGFVALGCPKQEKWMAANYERFNGPLLGIGGALPVYVGVIGRAPIWVQKASLEWLYRLLKEPRRLFKRYFYTNSKYLWLNFISRFKSL